MSNFYRTHAFMLSCLILPNALCTHIGASTLTSVDRSLPIEQVTGQQSLVEQLPYTI